MKSILNLQKIVSIKDKPGLYLLKSFNPKGYHVQPLQGGRVMTIANEKGRVLALGNVDLKLTEGSINLLEVFKRLSKNDKVARPGTDLREEFRKIIPDLDDASVANSHLTKVVKWYLQLQEHLKAEQVINEEDDGLTII